VPITHPLPTTGPCPVCGVDETRLSIDDALDTVRTLGRRSREAFAGLAPGAERVRPEPDGWSMLDVAVHVRDVLTRLSLALDDALDGHHPHFDGLVPTLRPDVDGVETAPVLEVLDAAARRLAARAERTSMLAWDRVIDLDGDEQPARTLLQRAAHEGAHHLRDLQRIRRVVAPSEDE
jgi:DinB superfamily